VDTWVGRHTDTNAVRLHALHRSTSELIRNQRFEQAQRILDNFASRSSAPGTSIDTARSLSHLCSAAAEHHRLSKELEGAADRHRVAQQDVQRAIAGQLARWQLPASRRQANRENAQARPRLSLPDERGSTSSAGVQVHMLGPLVVTIDGTPIERWDSLKARALFEYLMLHCDKPVRRELLMHVFWPRHSRGSARNNLNVSLYNLRRTLADGGTDKHILYADGCYQLNPEISWWIDRTEFLSTLAAARGHVQDDDLDAAVTAYQAAVDLYRGPLFEDDTTSEWHHVEQTHITDVYLEALESLGELHLQLHDLTLAEQTAKQALVDDPCRESAHRLLMRCYAQQHQHHLVSRQLQICAATLRRQLGIAPAPETIHVCESITAAR
jgi:DNA-binding SARP family transcriptional activator